MLTNAQGLRTRCQDLLIEIDLDFPIHQKDRIEGPPTVRALRIDRSPLYKLLHTPLMKRLLTTHTDHRRARQICGL